LGIDVFNDYSLNEYKSGLKKEISRNSVGIVFINLSNAIGFSSLIKNIDKNVKVVLCSHGIEGGDLIHNIVRNTKKESYLQNFISSYKFGEIFKKDLKFRIDSLDLILTVSDVEVAIENWLGAKDVVLVPRILKPNFLKWRPKKGRLGFVADVSHFPNYYGLEKLCKALYNDNISNEIELIIVGKPCENINKLKSVYPFIESMGYLNDIDLQEEAASWMYFLNLVFYYSKGVSTKLQLGLNWGLPVLTTPQGNRGYIFKQNSITICKNEIEMVKVIKTRLENHELLLMDKSRTEVTVHESIKQYDVMLEIIEKLNN
jgi:hypothetical protein